MQVSSLDDLNAAAIPIPGQPGRLYLPFGDLGECASCGRDGDATGVPGYVPASMLDQPYRMDKSGVGLAKAYGQVMGIDALAQVDESSVQPNVAMVRATNSASLVAAVLLKFKPEVRQAVLEELGGIAWSQSVLKLAGKMPGALGISDAVRFSLGMHYLIGIYDDAAKKQNHYTDAYNKTVAFFRGIEKGEQLAENALDGVPSGSLGALGDFLGIGSAMKKAGKAVVSAAKTAVKAVEKVADFTSDILCKGLKAILGPQLGGMVCFLFTKLIDLIKNTLKTIIKIIEAAGTSLLSFIENLAKGKFLDAVMALMKGITKITFFLLGPVVVTFLGMSFEKLEELADKVVKKSPFFPIAVALGIFGVVAGPTTTNISTLILALLPAISVLVAPALKKIIDMSIDKLEEAFEKFMKLALIIFVGYMKLQELMPKFKVGMQKFLAKKGGASGAAKGIYDKAVSNLQSGWGKIMKAFQSFKLSELSTALSAFFSLVGPALLGGLTEDADTSELVSSSQELVAEVKKSANGIEEQDKALKAAQVDMLKALSKDQRRQVVMDQAKQLQPTQSASAVAQMIRDNLDDPKKKDTFIRDFKTNYRGPDIILLSNRAPGATPSAAAKKGVSQVPSVVTTSKALTARGGGTKSGSNVGLIAAVGGVAALGVIFAITRKA